MKAQLVTITLALLAVAAAAASQRAPAIEQPLPMSHARHLQSGMKCRACHQGVESQALASFPTLADCLDCHSSPQGKDPEEVKVRELAKRSDEIHWAQVNRAGGQVYFSHAAHVTLAKMRCEDCHGDMTKVTRPLVSPDVHQDMAACIACHRQRQATEDCLACHR